ncbi:MAG: helix-turn-helix transcriptional regulator [Bacteroidetes bacterium]|nr:helix-turn-helix transcriptional regulator [Bacteroidota bacterium]
MSQKEIATALSLTTTAYSCIEAGQTQLTINNLFNIADKLSEPITTLLGLPDSGIAHNHHSVVMSNFNSGHIHIDTDAAKMLNNLKGKI